jgi:hypothetical protein
MSWTALVFQVFLMFSLGCIPDDPDLCVQEIWTVNHCIGYRSRALIWKRFGLLCIKSKKNPTERRKLHEFKADIPNRKDISMSNNKTS